MQTDMHYYGTYALARAAGLTAPAATLIATAAEYVDDSDYVDVQLDDGVYIHAAPTAHHPTNKENVQPVDQRRVWVPFHFLPGNQGDSREERLVCRKDSTIARQMVEYHLAAANENFILQRMGIAAHVYADTFSHYGFSGIASPWNRVVAHSIQLHVKSGDIFQYIKDKAEDFEDKYIKGKVANVVGLGHGSVATYPDRPYLVWDFRYDFPARESGKRSNPDTFLEAAEKLHAIFVRLATALPDQAEPGRTFPSIRDVVARIIAIEGEMNERIDAWRSAAVRGELFGPATGDDIPKYNSELFGDDIATMSQHTSESVSGTDGFAFLMAAKLHRDYVLNELLPDHGLTVLRTM